jgi:hypothetical protein
MRNSVASVSVLECHSRRDIDISCAPVWLVRGLHGEEALVRSFTVARVGGESSETHVEGFALYATRDDGHPAKQWRCSQSVHRAALGRLHDAMSQWLSVPPTSQN